MKKGIAFASGIALALGAFISLATISNPPSGGGTAPSDTAYSATTWDGVTTIAPTKNAVRDKINVMDGAIAGAQSDASSASGAALAAQATADAAAAAVAAIPLVIVANGQQLAQTSARSLTEYTPTEGKYRVGVWATITAVSVDVLQIQCTWSDQNGVSQTKTFFPQGLTSANLGSTGAYVFPTMDISTDAGSNILVETILTVGAGSITYDAGATIQTLPIPSP